MSRIRAALLFTALYAPLAHAGDFLDARFSFNLTDENLLVKPGQTVPSIPGVRFGAPIPRWGLFFYENYDSRLSGFENFTNMVLYKDLMFGQEEIEGALVLRFSSVSDVLSGIYDGGSYIKWTHWMDAARGSNTNISVTAFPFSSDLFRLGYSYKISWAGSPLFFKPNPDNPYAQLSGSNTNAVPGLRVQFGSERVYAFAGAKTSLLLNQADNQQEPIYGFLAGAGVDITSFLRVEANGGYFYRGTNPIQAVLGAPVVTYGASAQVMLHSGVPVGRSADFPLYRNDPAASFARSTRPEEYPGGLSWLVSAEATATSTTLQDPDPTRSMSTTRQTGLAGDLNARIKWNHMRLRADLSYMDTAYLLLNVPSFVPFQALSPNLSTTTPQFFGSAGIDYFFENQRLTLGVTAGVQLPATFQGNLPASFANDLPPDALPLSTTVVVRQDGIYDVLPAGYSALPIYGGKVTAMLSFLYFNIVLDVLTGYDNNVTHLARINNDPQQVATRVFNNPWQLGFNLALQARL
jgi:hypothetical protein